MAGNLLASSAKSHGRLYGSRRARNTTRGRSLFRTSPGSRSIGFGKHKSSSTSTPIIPASLLRRCGAGLANSTGRPSQRETRAIVPSDEQSSWKIPLGRTPGAPGRRSVLNFATSSGGRGLRTQTIIGVRGKAQQSKR